MKRISSRIHFPVTLLLLLSGICLHGCTSPEELDSADNYLEVLKEHWDGETIDGPMVDEIREVLEHGGAEASKPLRDRLAILESSGEVYREDFALWWKTTGRLEAAGSVLWKRDLLREALQLAVNNGGGDEVMSMIREAAESGHPAARLWVVRMDQQFSRGGGTDGMSEWSDILAQAKELADDGDPESSLLLWQLLERDGSESGERLVGWLENAAEAGYTMAIEELIQGHRRGSRGIPWDPERVAYWESRLDGAEGRSPSEGRKAHLEASSAKNLKHMWLSMKMYAGESRGSKFPGLSLNPGRLTFRSEQIYPEYLVDTSVLISPAHPEAVRLDGTENRADLIDDHSYWYLGYTISDETVGLRFIEEYTRRVREGEVLEGDWNVASKAIYALREGIERFLITDINNPRSVSISGSKLPIMIERPFLHADGSYVLFLDGHVEFIEYPGKFPMTRRFIEGLESLDSLAQ